MSTDELKFKEGYHRAKCCSPQPHDSITGYFSYNNVMIVHKSSCSNLKKVESKRLLSLFWDEILEKEEENAGEDFFQLDQLDFLILQHHKVLGIDYSLMVASILQIEPEEAFKRHKKLKDLKLLERVGKVMIQYRKNIVDNKWIKHRNHTYYGITPKGEKYLNSYLTQKGKDSQS